MPSAAATVRVAAPAKINLALRVLGRRADGFHEIATVLQALSLHDTLEVHAAPGPLRLEVRGADFELPETENLAYRAAAACLGAAGRPAAGFRLVLTKRIPSGAGLGGGSSDAAAVLRAFGRLLAPALGAEVAGEIAASLGSDVPFFLGTSPALATGRGERLSALAPLPPLWYVLAKPPRSVATAWAYGALGLTVGPPPLSIPRFDPTELGTLGSVGNDLERAVLARVPEVAALKVFLADRGADLAAMSGSGAAVFGAFRDRRRARAAAAALRRRGDCWVATARPLDGRLS